VPEKTELGLPGVDSSGAWVGKHLRHTGDPLVALAGLGKAWNGSSSIYGGTAVVESTS